LSEQLEEITRKSVYDPAQIEYRVSFAIAHILRGGGESRLFDTCFEMNDADQVAARIYRRALSNPALMTALPRYLRIDMCRENYECIFGTHS